MSEDDLLRAAEGVRNVTRIGAWVSDHEFEHVFWVDLPLAGQARN